MIKSIVRIIATTSIPFVSTLQSATYFVSSNRCSSHTTDRIRAFPPGQGEQVSEQSDDSRRRILQNGLLTALSIELFAPGAAGAVYNPLNLKGSYWETGELYQKKENEIPYEPAELITSLKKAETALDSLTSLVLEGKFDTLSKQLRGGAVSESQLRLRAYALIDSIENDEKMYEASDLFRNFLRDFDRLDRTVEAAVRQSKIDGGVVETLGLAVVAPIGAANEMLKISSEQNLGKDARINVLAVLGAATKSLHAFNKTAEDAIAN
mmetsp:Transcript_22391/g.34507  ORF Transcript_22391/g.34507 Transcript_22391/m.34507 type:complete len:266 (+) Transcript_22391:80-877(+)